VFGYPSKEVNPVSIYDLSDEEQKRFIWIDDKHPGYAAIEKSRWDELYDLYCKGWVLIEALELMALRIVKESKACRNYLKARFTHVYIDEYQDADSYTHCLFMEFVGMGMNGIVVGDKNQSIFGFAHKNSQYLVGLSHNPDFTAFSLLDNFRCSLPIINYSSRLLDANYQVKPTTECGVVHMTAKGAEDEVANLLSHIIPKTCSQMKIKDMSQVAILVKKRTFQELLNNKLTIPHRLIETTVLDRDMNPRSRLYAELLQFYFDPKMSIFSVIDEFEDYENLTLKERQRLMTLVDLIREVKENEMQMKLPILFPKMAKILIPQYPHGHSMKHLTSVLNDQNLLNTYRPLSEKEVVLMTLHKSKGLEFDVVFHLNMNEWELPGKKPGANGDFNHPEYVNYEQDLDLHYVGITRARKVCFLISSSRRTNTKGTLSKANPSEFLNLNGLEKLRVDIKSGLR